MIGALILRERQVFEEVFTRQVFPEENGRALLIVLSPTIVVNRRTEASLIP